MNRTRSPQINAAKDLIAILKNTRTFSQNRPHIPPPPPLSRDAVVAAAAAVTRPRHSAALRSDLWPRRAPLSPPPPPRSLSSVGTPPSRQHRRRRARCPPRRFVDVGDAPVANLRRRRHLQVARVQARRTRAPARPASPCFAAGVRVAAAAAPALVMSSPRHCGLGCGDGPAAGPACLLAASALFFSCFSIF